MARSRPLLTTTHVAASLQETRLRYRPAYVSSGEATAEIAASTSFCQAVEAEAQQEGSRPSKGHAWTFKGCTNRKDKGVISSHSTDLDYFSDCLID